jgi:hypothetical protein
MLGAVISWGILWPVILSKKGDWYPANTDSSSMQGLYGYKIFITLSIFTCKLRSMMRIFSLSLTKLPRKD